MSIAPSPRGAAWPAIASLALSLVIAFSTAAFAVCNYQPLTSGVPQLATEEGFFQFTATAPSWSAVAIHASGTDWDLFAYSSTAAEPACVSGDLAASVRFSGIDIVVGDFHHNPLGTYYVGATRPLGTGGAFIEWDNGADQIIVDADPVLRDTDDEYVVEIWDVALEAGVTYTIYLQREGNTDARAILFRNPGTTYWAGYDAAVLNTIQSAHYTAPATDVYGIAVLNENLGVGRYRLGVYRNGVDAGASTPKAFALRSLAPNPCAGPVRATFDLAAAAHVRFDWIDVTGRVRARVDVGEQPAGARAVSLDPRSGARAALAPGVYFVEMTVDGRSAGRKRLVLLE